MCGKIKFVLVLVTAVFVAGSAFAQQKFCTDPNATFTGAVAIFTLCLFGAAVWQGILINRQIKLGRQEYNASHRPRIKIQHIFCEPLEEGSVPKGNIAALNFGDTDAIIESNGVDIFCRIKGVGSSGFKIIPIPVNISPIEPGNYADLMFKSGNNLPPKEIISNAEFCMIGRITYKDCNNVMRITSFFRVYDHISKRFIHAPKDDEYSDWEYEA